MVVCLSILKHLEDLSEDVLIEHWVQNPYYHAFCGETEFQWQLPCDPSEMTCFGKRIGTSGFETTFTASIALHGDAAMGDEVCVDTTVQE